MDKVYTCRIFNFSHFQSSLSCLASCGRICSLVSVTFKLNYSDTLRPNLTPDPRPRTPAPSDGPSTRGLDGTCVEGGRQPRPLPPTAGVQYLLVCRRRASAWPAPAWWGFHLGGGSPTSDRVCLQSEKEERERTSSMQTRHQAQTDLHSGSVVCFEPVRVPDGWRQSVRGKQWVKRS